MSQHYATIRRNNTLAVVKQTSTRRVVVHNDGTVRVRRLQDGIWTTHLTLPSWYGRMRYRNLIAEMRAAALAQALEDAA